MQSHPSYLSSDLLPDDCKRDWPANELHGDLSWLLADCDPDSTSEGEDRYIVAQVLRLSGLLPPLAVLAVSGNAAGALYRWVFSVPIFVEVTIVDMLVTRHVSVPQ